MSGSQCGGAAVRVSQGVSQADTANGFTSILQIPSLGKRGMREFFISFSPGKNHVNFKAT